MKIEILIELHQ